MQHVKKNFDNRLEYWYDNGTYDTTINYLKTLLCSLLQAELFWMVEAVDILTTARALRAKRLIFKYKDLSSPSDASTTLTGNVLKECQSSKFLSDFDLIF